MDDRYVEIGDGSVDPPVVWRFDRGFLGSNWSCIWGRGCQGILDRLAPELDEGCCSEGAALVDDGDAMNVAANAAAIPALRWQYRTGEPLERRADGRWFTKIVDDACVFLNRPGFGGGGGCALHLGALELGERPLDWKPNVCWQMPLKVDREVDDAGRTVRCVRPWSRTDWGSDASLAWFCTEAGSGAYVGDETVLVTMADELIELVGHEVYLRLAHAMGGRTR